jgi:hypothetical protein
MSTSLNNLSYFFIFKWLDNTTIVRELILQYFVSKLNY